MAFSGIGTLAVCLLLTVTNGQFTPDANQEVCDDMKQNDYLTDNTYCQLFYRCTRGQQHTMNCGADLLFNSETDNCYNPTDAMCQHWPCNAEKNGTKYPHLCHEKYFQCTNGGFMVMNCPSDTHFNMADGECESGAGTDHELCLRNNGTNSDLHACNNFPHSHGDVCMYRTMTGNNTYSENMPCPETTAFNATSCNCDIINNNCPKSTVKSRSKLPDPQCRPSYEVNFIEYNDMTGMPLVYCEKDGAFLDYYLDSRHVQFSPGAATLSTDAETGEKPYLYAYNFNNNQLTPYVGMCLIFKPSGPTTNPIHLFTNDYFNACAPTVDLTATVDDTNLVTVILTLCGMTRYSVTNTTTASGTLTASMPLPSGHYVEVCLYFNGMPHIKITDMGADGATKGTPTQAHGTAMLGSTICTNKCGLRIGYDLDGIIKQIRIYEGCRNNTIFFS